MNTRNTTRNVSLAGIVVSVALAGVTYLISTGGSGDGHGPTWCFFIFAVLEYVSWQYLFYCTVYTCPGPGKDENSECIHRCFVRFIIIQVILIIFLLVCLLATGPKW
jgi:hypothetical protein